VGALLSGLREPELRLIAQKRLEGYTNQEIADELQCTLRTVKRKLERIRTYWGKAEE
jgi:DNA-directed RNA polymerase specialized sigma24 family protein